MMYVGDNPSKDFQACKQLGMRWVYFKNVEGIYSISGIKEGKSISSLKELIV